MTREEYLKHKEIIDAWANGDEIQYNDGLMWQDVKEPTWLHCFEYRIKPKPTYLELHEQCGLKVGDRVRIVREWSKADGANIVGFINDMLYTINKIGIVTKKDSDSYKVDFKDDNTFWFYPYFVLEKIEDEYIPFTFEDDIIGKIVTRKGVKNRFLITGQHENEVFTGICWTSLSVLLEHYTFLDGSPCGKLKQ